MSNQTFSFTVTVSPPPPEPSTIPEIEVARPLEPYYLPPPHTQQALLLTRQIGVSIDSASPVSIQISSPTPVTLSQQSSSHPPPIRRPHSPPPLNIPTSLPHRIPKECETEAEHLRDHLHKFTSTCQHELDILETRRRDALHIYKDIVVYERLSEKYDKMWNLWQESRKLCSLLSE